MKPWLGTRSFADRVFATALYRLSLSGSVPARLTRLPPARISGEPNRGQDIVSGRLVCADAVFDTEAPTWFAPDVAAGALAELHAFAWLDDLAAAGTPQAHACARNLIASWLRHAADWQAEAWAPGVVGRRLISWLSHARFIAAAGDNDPLSAPLLASAARQTRHLARTAASAPPGIDRLAAAAGLIYAGLCGFGERAAARGLRLLVRELDCQVLADGAHVERSPEHHARAFSILVDVEGMLTAAAQPVPAQLRDAIGRMAAILRLFRHGDGSLALFNHTGAVSGAWLDAVLARAGASNPAPQYAPQAGFVRLPAGETLVVMDVGPPPSAPFDRDAHAGILSFELSCGRERMIVNCGTRGDGEWQQAARTTAAHSTVVIDDTNSAELLAGGGIGRRPSDVEVVLESSDGNHWLTASHDGYGPVFGVRHTRRLYLAASGRDLRGEDTLTGRHGGSYAVRFHLQPGVRASLLQNAAAVLLRMPSGAAWRMQVGTGALAVGESIYLAAPGGPRRSDQIVITGRLEGEETVVKWALRRIDG